MILCNYRYLVKSNKNLQYGNHSSSGKSFDQGKSFSKVGQSSRSRSQVKKLWYHVKGLVTRNTHVQYMYESPVSSGKEVMAKVKKIVHAHTSMPTTTQTLGLWHKLPGHWFQST